MFSRSSRGLLLLGIVFSLIALSACAAGGDSVSMQASAVAAAPAVTARPGTAMEPVATATATHGEAVAHAAAAHTSAASPPQALPPATSAGPPVSVISGPTVYGFSAPELLNQSSQIDQLEAMKAMGVTSIRVDADWYWAQPSGPGSYNWTSLDQIVASIQKVGLSADFIIDGCPPWAAVATAKGDEFAQPASSLAFATWARAVAARYGGKGVKYFEIWNEPNLSAFWAPKPDPAAYTADLVAAYAAIKAVDASAIVITGGLAPAANTSDTYDPRTFLTDIYADGGKGSFDGVGDHPYSYPATPGKGLSAWTEMSGTSPSLRGIMTQHGDSGKKIWITEYGAPTLGTNSVGDDGQSAELAQAIAKVKQTSWIGSLYIYTWKDLSTDPADQAGFGVLSVNGDRKPAYAVVADALAS